jgi:hypothetical protein
MQQVARNATMAWRPTEVLQPRSVIILQDSDEYFHHSGSDRSAYAAAHFNE